MTGKEISSGKINGKEVAVADIEADGFNATKIWCLSYVFVDSGSEGTLTDYDKMRSFLSNPDMILIIHFGLGYDKPTLERILEIEIKCEVICSLGLSWYLYPTRSTHGLEDWGEEFGIPKPEIDDWESLTLEEYCYRCEEDVKINLTLWKKIVKDLNLLYGKGEWLHALEYINFKMECLALQAKTKWKINVDYCKELLAKFEKCIDDSKKALEEGMPDVPKYVVKTRPKKPFKKSGELSAIGLKWKALTEEHGYDFDYTGEIKVINKYEPPNAGSHQQVKDWAYSLGWKPCTFDFKRNKETGEVRKIPQIKDSDTGEICDSLKIIAETVPAMNALNELSILIHRKSIVKGFLDNMDENGCVVAAAHGFTNTLRLRHKICVNLPSLRKPYGKEIRSCLTVKSDDNILLGSDQASLEDRTKQHYMWDYDPEYVKEMQKPGFDPHCTIAQEAGIMSAKEVAAYKWLSKNDVPEKVGKDGKLYNKKVLAGKRHSGKSCNYSSTYGAGGATIARAAGVDEDLGHKLHEAYWTKNWSLKAIAEDCQVKQSRKIKWLWNPVAKMWYWLKTEKDRFSTLNQGTGSYVFDLWVKEILKVRYSLTAQFHDEVIIEILKGEEEFYKKLLENSVDKVNKRLKLNRDLAVDVEFGNTYADIH